MSERVRRIAKRVGIALGAIGLLAFVVLLIAHTKPVRRLVVDSAGSWAQAEFGVAVSVGELDYNLFALRGEIKRLELKRVGSDVPFVVVERLLCDLGWAVALGTVDIEVLEVESPTVTIIRDETGTNLPSIPESEESGPPPPIRLGRAHVTGLSFQFTDASKGTRLSVSDINAVGKGSSFGVVDLDLSFAGDGPFFLGDRSAALHRLQAQATLSATRFTVQQFVIDTSLGFLSGNGTVDVAGDGAVAAKYAGKADVEALADFVREGGLGEGTVNVRGSVSGTLDGLLTRLEANGSELVWQDLDGFSFQTELNVTERAITVESFTCDIADGVVDLDGQLAFGDETEIQSAFRVNASNLQVAPLLSAAGPDAAVAAATALSATALSVAGDVALVGTDVGTLVLDLHVKTESIDTNGGPPALVGSLDVEVSSGAYLITFDEAFGDALAVIGTTEGRLDIDEPLESTVAGTVDLTGDLAELARIARSLGIEAAAKLPPGLAGKLTSELALAGSFAAPVVRGGLAIEKLEAGGVTDGEISARINVDVEEASFAEVELSGGPVALTGGGQFDIASKKLVVDLTGSLDAPGEIAAHVPEKLTLASRAEFILGDDLSEMLGDATLAIGGFEIDGETNRLDLDVELVDGVAEFTGGVSPSEVSIRGTVELSDDLRFDVAMAVDDEDLLDLLDRYDIRGGLVGRVSARGSLARGEVEVAELSIERLAATFAESPVTLTRPIVARFEQNVLFVEKAELLVGELALTADGSYGPSANGLTFAAVGPLDAMQPLVQQLAIATPIKLAGALDYRAELSGYGEQLRLSSSLSTTGDPIRVGPARIHDIELTAGIESGLIAVDVFAFGVDDARAEFHADVPLALLSAGVDGAALEIARASGRIDGLDEDTVERMLGVTLKDEVDIKLAASFELTAHSLRIEALNGEFRLEKADLVAGDASFAQDGEGLVTISDGLLTVERLAWKSDTNLLTLDGRVELAGEQPSLDLRLDADASLSLFGSLLPGTATGGRAAVDLHAHGPVTAPEIDGTLELFDGAVQLRGPRMGVAGIHGRVVLDDGRLVVERLTGMLNRGALEMDGELTLAGLRPVDGIVSVEVSDLELHLLEHFQNEWRSRITFSAGDVPTIGGEIVLVVGEYTEPFSIVQLLRSDVGGVGGVAVPKSSEKQDTGALDDVVLDLALRTEDDVFIDNNYGKLWIGSDLKLVGTVASPGLEGQVSVRPGSVLKLAGTEFVVDEATISFDGSPSFRAYVDVLITTRLSGVDVQIIVSGLSPDLRVTVASDPPLPEADILSLLTTGKTTANAGESESTTSSGKLSTDYLTEDVWGYAGQKLGVDRVRVGQGIGVDDSLLVVSNSASLLRLTVSKSFSRWFELILSQALEESNDLTTKLIYRPWRPVSLTVTSHDDNSRTLELRHELVFGHDESWEKPPELAKRKRPVVRTVTIEVDGGVSVERLRRRLKLREGKKFEFTKWRKDKARLFEELHGAGYLEAHVKSVRVDIDDLTVGLTYEVELGAKTVLSLRGDDIGGLEKSVRKLWISSIADSFLCADVVILTKRRLAEDHRFRPTISCELTVADDESMKELRVDVGRGEKTKKLEFVFDGNQEFDDETLTRDLAELESSVWLEPEIAERLIENRYLELGFLDVSVTALGPEFDGTAATLTFQVADGARYLVGDVRMAGGSDPDTLAALEVQRDDLYLPGMASRIRQRAESHYLKNGYNATVSVESVRRPDTRTVDFVLTVEKGVRYRLVEVVVDGGDRTNAGLISRQLSDIKVGEPTDLDALYAAQSWLYRTGVFREVDLAVSPVDGDREIPKGATEVDVIARFRLQEAARWRIEYGLQVLDPADATEVADEFRIGLLGQLRRQNIFGLGWSAGLGGSYLFGAAPQGIPPESSEDETRIQTSRAQLRGQLIGTLDTPRIWGVPIRTSLQAGVRREEGASVDELQYDDDVFFASLKQTYRWGSGVDLNYGYTFEHHRTSNYQVDPDVPPVGEFSFRVARIGVTGILDRRDDPMDTRDGWFYSMSMDYADEALGSEFEFLKGLGKFFYHLPIGPVVSASAIRIGAGYTYGDTNALPLDDRFFAGGATTVRGFRQDTLTPLNDSGLAIGGESLIVLNQEVRFPLKGWFSGVVFADAGRAFASLSEFDFGDLAVSVGAGIRINTPVALVRIDYGVPLTDGTVDNWIITIGHAF